MMFLQCSCKVAKFLPCFPSVPLEDHVLFLPKRPSASGIGPNCLLAGLLCNLVADWLRSSPSG